MSLRPGVLVGERYLIRRHLAVGGMGDVYEATDEKLGLPVAVKLSWPDTLRPDEFVGRFRREAKIGGLLGRRRGFVRVLDWGPWRDDALYLVMDLVENAIDLDLTHGTREARLDRLARAADLVRQVHDLGIVHRDVKPDNFLVGRDGEVFLADFGLAKLLEAAHASGIEPEPHLTLTGQILGTAAFFPPEQYRDSKRVDERADVYALGVMLYQALTGVMPSPEKLSQVVAWHQARATGAAPAPHPSAIDASIPPRLDSLCVRALDLEMERRPRNAGVFLAELQGRPAPTRAVPSPAVRRPEPTPESQDQADHPGVRPGPLRPLTAATMEFVEALIPGETIRRGRELKFRHRDLPISFLLADRKERIAYLELRLAVSPVAIQGRPTGIAGLLRAANQVGLAHPSLRCVFTGRRVRLRRELVLGVGAKPIDESGLSFALERFTDGLSQVFEPIQTIIAGAPWSSVLKTSAHGNLEWPESLTGALETALPDGWRYEWREGILCMRSDSDDDLTIAWADEPFASLHVADWPVSPQEVNAYEQGGHAPRIDRLLATLNERSSERPYALVWNPAHGIVARMALGDAILERGRFRWALHLLSQAAREQLPRD